TAPRRAAATTRRSYSTRTATTSKPSAASSTSARSRHNSPLVLERFLMRQWRHSPTASEWRKAPMSMSDHSPSSALVGLGVAILMPLRGGSAGLASGATRAATRCSWAAVPQPPGFPEKQGPPGPYGYNADDAQLDAVDASSKSNVWAVGSYGWSDGDRG